MASLYEARNAFHLRVRSTVDVFTGQPLRERKQQSLKLVGKDALHRTKNSPSVLKLAAAKQEQIQQWERQFASGEIRPDTSMSIPDFYRTVFVPHIDRDLSPSTVKGYKNYWSLYLADHFEGKTLAGYESFQATTFLERLAVTKSKNTLSHARAIGSAIFAHAISKGYRTSDNPFRDARRNIKCVDVEETYAYNIREVEDMLAALDKVSDRLKFQARTAQMLISVCFYAGLRPSEAAGLRWQSVDFVNNRLHICEVYVDGQFKKATKTKKSRYVPTLPALRGRLLLWHSQNENPAMGLVFPNQAGDKPVNVNDLASYTINETVTASGFEWHGLYACRRGFGTLLVEAGASLEEVAVAMGNSPEVVFQHYFKNRESKMAVSALAKLQAAMTPLALGAGEGQQ